MFYFYSPKDILKFRHVGYERVWVVENNVVESNTGKIRLNGLLL